MTTLVDTQIEKWAVQGGLYPFSRGQINPASVNLRIGNEIKIDTPHGLATVSIDGCNPDNPYFVNPHDWLLTHTAETVTLGNMLEAELVLRSSAARAGWNHAFSGYADPGWSGKLTLELWNVRPFHTLKLYPGLELVQLRLRRLSRAPAADYSVTGRYQGDNTVNHCQDPTIS